MTLLTTLTTLVLGVPFAEPPAVTLTPLPTDPAALASIYPQDELLPGADEGGYVYTRHFRLGLGTTSDARCVPASDPAAVEGAASCQEVIACWHPSNPEGTRRYLYLRADVVSLQSARFDPRVVWPEGLVAMAGAIRPQHRIFSCERDGFDPSAPIKLPNTDTVALPPYVMTPMLMGTRLCGIWDRNFFSGGGKDYALSCVASVADYAVFSNGAPDFRGETVFRLAELDATLGIPPLAPNADGEVRKVKDSNGAVFEAYEEWLPTSDRNLELPDGVALLTFIRRSVASDGQEIGRWQNTSWVFHVKADAHEAGDLTVLHRPAWPLRKPWLYSADPDLTLGRPFHDRADDLILFPANGQEFGNRRFSICADPTDCADDVPRGTLGAMSRGFFVLPRAALGTSRPTLGYVSATDAFYAASQSYTSGAQTLNQDAALEVLGAHLAWTFSAPGTTPHTHLLTFHPDRFDLDGDGILAPEEATLGTSDLDPNSDDDLASDRAERDLGADPADPDSLPVPRDAFGATQLTTSALIQRRLGPLVPTPWRTTGNASAIVRSHAANGPLCVVDAPAAATGTCWDLGAHLVARFPVDPSVRERALAFDGRHLVTLDRDDTITSFDLLTAQTRTFDFSAPSLDTGASLHVYPLDGDTFYLARWPSLNPAVWVVDEGDQRMLFDLDAAETAAGFTTPAGGFVETMGLLHEHFEVLGFQPDPRPSAARDAAELVLAVQGHWRRYLLALTTDGRTRELLRTRSSGLGDLPVSSESSRGLWTPSALVAPDGGFVAPLGLRLDTGDSFAHRPIPTGGTILVENRNPQDLVQPQQAGLHELVAFDPELDPGETLIFVSRWIGAINYLGYDRFIAETRGPVGMLFRVGARGGIVPAWAIDPLTNQLDPSRFDDSFVDVSGMDLDPRHHLCLADRGADTLRIYRPTQSGDIPEVLVERLTVPGLRDCRWRAHGAISILIEEGDPDTSPGLTSRVLTRPQDAPTHDLAAFVADPDAPTAPTRRAFVKGPGVDLELIPFGTTAYVAGPEAAYARVSYDLESGAFASPWGTLTLKHLASQDHPSIVLRPDGRAVLLPSIVYKTSPERAEPMVLVDPSTPSDPTTYINLATFNGGDAGHGMVAVAVPWERMVDPWTGAALDPANPFATPRGPSFPTPLAPTGGTPVEGSGSAPDEGCGGGSGSALGAFALLAWVVSRRPRAR